MLLTRLRCSMSLLLSVAACGSDGRDPAEDGADDDPGPGLMDGGSLDGRVINDVDANLRPDSTVSTRDGAADASGDATVATDGAILGASCADGFPRGAASSERRAVRRTMPTIEGVAVCPNGDVFVTAASLSEVWRIPLAGGEPEVWYKQQGGVFAGLDCDAQNHLYAADFGWLTAAGNVVSISGKNTGTLLPSPDDSATQGYHSVLAVAGKGVYASDTVAGRIMLWHDVNGVLTATPASYAVDGPNGLALGTDGRLYVALNNSALLDDEVVSFAIGSDGTLTDRTRAWTGPHDISGIAIDENGTLYITFPSEGKVVRASDGATVATATNTAGLAFRGGTLLYTDFDRSGSRSEKLTGIISTTGQLWAIELGVCGAP
jgi:hypothetical protein